MKAIELKVEWWWNPDAFPLAALDRLELDGPYRTRSFAAGDIDAAIELARAHEDRREFGTHLKTTVLIDGALHARVSPNGRLWGANDRELVAV